MKPLSTISAIRPSMIADVSTTMRGSPAWSVAALAVAAAKEADCLGGHDQVAPLGDGQPEHAQPEEQRHAKRQRVPERRRQVGERDAEEQPHQQTEREADDRGHELRRRQVLDL